MTQLSPHFSLEEFTFSETASRMGLEVRPTQGQIANAERLCWQVLEPVRVQLGRVLFILSGIRPDWLNDAVGGAKNSQHRLGCAADVKAQGFSPTEFAHWIRENGFPVDQVIVEFDRWVHISIAETGEQPRGEYLRAKKVGSRTVYELLT